jgi:hypothetical protein
MAINLLQAIPAPMVGLPTLAGINPGTVLQGSQLGASQGQALGANIADAIEAMSPEAKAKRELAGALANAQLEAAKKATSKEGVAQAEEEDAMKRSILKSQEISARLKADSEQASSDFRKDPTNEQNEKRAKNAAIALAESQNELQYLQIAFTKKQLQRGDQPINPPQEKTLSPIAPINLPVNPMRRLDALANVPVADVAASQPSGAIIPSQSAIASASALEPLLAPVYDRYDATGKNEMESETSKAARQKNVDDRNIQQRIINEAIKLKLPVTGKTSGELEKLISDFSTTELSSMKDSEIKMAEKLSRYEIPYPGAYSFRNPRTQLIVAAAAEMNPTFDATQYGVRKKIREGYTSGNEKKNIDVLNTALGHLDDLQKASTKLNNTRWTSLNSLKNYIYTASTGDSAVKNFSADTIAVAGELAKVFKGGNSPALAEVEHWINLFNSSASPEQLHDGINEAIKLMKSRAEQLRNSYEEGMGLPADFNILNKHSRNTLKERGFDPEEWDPISTAKESPSKESDSANTYPTGDKVGRRRLQDGITYEFDGTNWNEVK